MTVAADPRARPGLPARARRPGRRRCVLGQPVLVVLAAPFVVLRRAGPARPAPPSAAGSDARLDHRPLHEGQGTRRGCVVDDLDGVEHVTRVAAPAPYVATAPGRTARVRLAGRRRPARRSRSARGGGGAACSARSRSR